MNGAVVDGGVVGREVAKMMMVILLLVLVCRSGEEMRCEAMRRDGACERCRREGGNSPILLGHFPAMRSGGYEIGTDLPCAAMAATLMLEVGGR
jgi:hypothetical protein